MRVALLFGLLILPTVSSATDAAGRCRGEGPLQGSCGAKSVLGRPLEPCRSRLSTGYFRDGYCRTDATDRGAHVVCAEVTQAFLEFTRARGNDLTTPSASFPGLKPGDAWCLCAARWREAALAGVTLPARTAATEESALKVATVQELESGRARGGR